MRKCTRRLRPRDRSHRSWSARVHRLRESHLSYGSFVVRLGLVSKPVSTQLPALRVLERLPPPRTTGKPRWNVHEDHLHIKHERASRKRILNQHKIDGRWSTRPARHGQQRHARLRVGRFGHYLLTELLLLPQSTLGGSGRDPWTLQSWIPLDERIEREARPRVRRDLRATAVAAAGWGAFMPSDQGNAECSIAGV